MKIERFVRASDFFPLLSPWGRPAASLGLQTIGICHADLDAKSLFDAKENVHEGE